MSFDSKRHPRGFSGKFISTGEHAFKSGKHSQNAGNSSRAARRVLSGPHFNTPNGKKAIAGHMAAAEKSLALARVHAHAAKRIESGNSGRLGAQRPGLRKLRTGSGRPTIGERRHVAGKKVRA